MRRSIRLVSDPILPGHRKEVFLKDKALECYKRNTRLVVLLLIIFSIFTLWWSVGQPQGTNPSESIYSVVFDAGSTGSRVHVYQFDIDQNGTLLLRGDDFHRLKPGIGSYADRPEEAGMSLDPLLTAINGAVPRSKMIRTPCQLRATAGLRMLSENQSEAILESIRMRLERTGYLVERDSVSILDGRYEGAYAWLTVNYLLERLASSSTVTTIDLGGGSVQESYEISSDGTDAKDSATSVNSDRGERNIYVHSYLNYGLMAARAAILKAREHKDHPCLAKGFDGYYEYGNERIVATNSESGSASACKDIVRQIMNSKKDCGRSMEQCTFDGVWGGPVDRDDEERSIYLFSYFWDRAVDVGIVAAAGISTWQTTASLYSEHANEICEDDMERLKFKFPHVDDAHLPYLCLDLTYISVLLTEGFKMDPFQEIHLAKQINYRGEQIETSWTLGAAIDGITKSQIAMQQ